MATNINVGAYHFDELKLWDEVQDILEEQSTLRLPTVSEAIYLDYEHQAIWTSEIIGLKHCVMDIHWGIQIVRSGCYGLILLEKENE